ncbi:hypothetical protein KR222_001236, partial [Zaprionus bogoriensis]
VDECRIKAIDRFHNSVTVSGTLKKTLSSGQVNFRFLKRERGGWHPFLYAMTVDVCKFLENPQKYPIPNLIYSYGKQFTNANHTCPYFANTSVTLSNWQPDGKSFISRFPIELGEYALHTVWYTNKKKVGSINGSIEIFT